MKLNNLSRLTALLMAVMLCSIPCASASGIDWSDLTGTQLAIVSNAEQMISAGYCETCSQDVASAGLTAWPIADYNCLYVHLKELTPSEAYDMLIGYYNAITDEGDALYEAYINSHNNHVYNAKIAGSSDYPAVICHEDCSATKWPLQIPGSTNHSETCPWYDAVYYPPVTTEPDVSTPDTLASLTEVKLTFTATGDNLTYTWQRSADPDAETPVWEDVATSSTYTLPIDAAALAYAYRCEVTDASDNVVSTSSTLYLGGKEFFAWVSSTEGEGTVVIRDWLLEGNKVEYVLAAYAAYLKGIALSEAIHVTTITETVDSTTVTSTVLLELLDLSTLAEIDAEGNVIDVRYHIAVATYKDGVITALPTNDTTATN